MADYFLSPVFNEATFNDDGAPGSGWTLTTYLAGTTTPATVYKDHLGSASHTNPIVLNTRGEPPAPIWIVSPESIKFVLKDSLGVTIRTIDNVSGVNDAVDLSVDEWQDFLGTPTYISATQFSLTGDQTSQFQVGRRLKTTNTGGTVYSRITVSAFAAGVTTVTVVNDSGVLDSGLSLVSVGALTASGGSIPGVILTAGAFAFQLPALFNAAVTINGAAPLVFEGATADAFETSLAVTDPTADRTITLADANFTVNAVGEGVKGLIGSSSGNSQITFSARSYFVRNLAGIVRRLDDTGSFTLNTATAGPAVDGRDQVGAFPNGSLVHAYRIADEAGNRHGILSLTGPDTFNGSTLPSGYTWWLYIGSYVLAAGTTNFAAISQKGDKGWYSGAAPPTLFTGTISTSWTQVLAATMNLYFPTNSSEMIIGGNGGFSNGAAATTVLVSVGPATGVPFGYLGQTAPASAGGQLGMGGTPMPYLSGGLWYIYTTSGSIIGNPTLNLFGNGYRMPVST